MMESDSIRLRRWCDADLPTLATLRNDVALQAQLLSRARGSNTAQVLQWLHTRTNDTDGQFWIIAERESDVTLGYLQFTGVDFVDRRAEMGICLMPNAQGHGTGRAALLMAMSYLAEQWGLRKISLRVRADNIAALKCYERVGFQTCGLLREHVFIDGGWQNLVLMECFLPAKAR